MKIIVLCLLFIAACVGDDIPPPAGYSCLIRFQCANTDDILARQYFTCAWTKDEAETTTKNASYAVAAERCGDGNWAWTWATCDAETVPRDCDGAP